MAIFKLIHHDPKEAQRIHTVFQRSYRVEADLIGVESFPPLYRTVVDFQKSRTSFWGYSMEGKLAAVVEINDHEEQLEICSLVVDPDFFRRGIAGKMMEYILGKFPRASTIVETAAANHPAISLYAKFGFEIIEKWNLAIGIEKVKMIKKD